jgi:tetratricopeptide (TPR) repeat protein
VLFSLYKEGGTPIEQVFDKYEDLKEKFEDEKKTLSLKLDNVLAKEEAGQPLTKKDLKAKKRAEINTKAFVIFESNMDKRIADIATCEVLVPMYTKNFDANKSNAIWLKRAAGRMVSKECTADPMFVKIVEAFHTLEPSAESAGYLGDLAYGKKDYATAKKYFEESANLHEDKYKKATMYYKIAQMEKRRGAKSSSRSFANKAIAQRPSYGSAYLLIASLYASSANDCGDTTFKKKAVYWLAEKTALKAGKVDPSSRSRAAKSVASYKAKAPTKQMIFDEAMGGKSVNIACWINRTVKVPNL